MLLSFVALEVESVFSVGAYVVPKEKTPEGVLI